MNRHIGHAVAVLVIAMMNLFALRPRRNEKAYKPTTIPWGDLTLSEKRDAIEAEILWFMNQQLRIEGVKTHLLILGQRLAQLEDQLDLESGHSRTTSKIL